MYILVKLEFTKKGDKTINITNTLIANLEKVYMDTYTLFLYNSIVRNRGYKTNQSHNPSDT